jgi:hypothetical protein
MGLVKTLKKAFGGRSAPAEAPSASSDTLSDSLSDPIEAPKSTPWQSSSKDGLAYTMPKTPSPTARGDVDPTTWAEQNPSAPGPDAVRSGANGPTIGVGGTRHLEAVLDRFPSVQRGIVSSVLQRMPPTLQKQLGSDPAALMSYVRRMVPDLDDRRAGPVQPDTRSTLGRLMGAKS